METLTLPMLDARETVEAACRDLVAFRRSGFVLKLPSGKPCKGRLTSQELVD
jgi:hypothetical protein